VTDLYNQNNQTILMGCINYSIISTPDFMKSIFPEPIQHLPKADIPLDGLTAYLSQADSHQTLYMQFEKNVDLPKHQHADQIGFVLEGKIEITIDGESKVYSKGDRYHIQAGVTHSAKIYAGYADITVFMQQDRYKVKI
jgi:quercetin dioxygenase-like cupin family protein